VKIRRSILAMLLALAGLCAISSSAALAATPEPAWKVLAATGPTHLPPQQSEVQRVTVLSEAGGSFTLKFGADTTAAIPFDAAPAVVQSELEALPSIGAGSVAVSGGPGGEIENPYLVAFTGSLAEQNVAELIASGSSLGEEGFANVFTTVQGGPGTGFIGVFPVNVGGAATSGEITVEVGPLPAGIVTSGPAISSDGSGFWSCTTAPSEAKCTASSVVKAVSPPPSIKVPIKTESLLPLSSSTSVRIEGGGASEAASYQLPIVVSPIPAPPGFAAFYSGSFDAAGEPATQAGGHPFSQVTAFHMNSVRSSSGDLSPNVDIKDVVVDLPTGFVGSPLVTERCPTGLPAPQIGSDAPACNLPEKERFTVGWLYPGTNFFGSLGISQSAPLTNSVPVGGAAAQFTTKIAGPVATLLGSVRSEEDYGITVSAPNSPIFQEVYYINTVFYGEPEGAKGKAFFRSGTACSEEAREAPAIDISTSSWQQPSVFTGASDTQAPVTGCDQLEFKNDFSFQPTSTQGSSGVGATAHLQIDQSGLTDPNALATPDLKRSVVTLPAGLTANPSQAAGLEACSEAQIGYVGSGALPNPTRFNNNPVSCPEGSKLGTVEVQTPLLEEPLNGTIYLAEQDQNPFGSLIALYLVIESERFGITLKLPGKVDLDPTNGQLTATFDHVPQQPVEDLTLRFRGGGPRSTLATPEVCGTYSTNGTWTPWSAPESGPPTQTTDGFTVSGNCSPSLAQRPFKPSFEAGAQDPLAGSYSPLLIKVNRADGEQELTSLDFTLPPGMTGKLAGVASCSDAAIESAKAKSGKSEQASPSCPAASRIGTIDAAVGVGAEPYHAAGAAYLAGPYKGAPLSAVAISPAVAGPFDLGNVVVRAPLFLDEQSAQITVKSDPIPTILKGIPLKVRSIAIAIDREQFSLNPTSCEAMAVNATIGGSGGATATPQNRFQLGGCERLAFKPKLSLRLKGATKRGGHPALTATLTTRPGDANIATLAVNLPHSEFLAQDHIRTICTRVQFAQGAGGGSECPAGSIYGQVKAFSPLLDYALEGPVILRSSANPLPDLVAVVRGPANQPIVIAQAGRIDSKNNGIRNSFEAFPDVPLSKAVVALPAGRKSLLENSTNICAGKHLAKVRSTAHNGRAHDFNAKLSASCTKAQRKAAARAARRARRS